MNIKKQVQDSVSNSQLDKAIDIFLEWANTNDKELSNNLLLIKSRLSALKRNENLGMIDFSEANRNRAQIANSILMMLDEVKEQNGGNINLPPSNTGTGDGNIITGTGDGRIMKKKILFLASNPDDTGKLQLDKEFRKVYQSLREGDDDYEVEVEWAITPSDLQRVILKHKPTILHFSGHGDKAKIEAKKGMGAMVSKQTVTIPAGIILQNGSGQSQLVSGTALAGLFAICLRKFPIDMVVLNACHSEEQAKAIAQAGVKYVVGMNTSVNDNTAIEFSTGLYRGISTQDGDYEFAFDLAKNNIMLMGLEGDNIPVLYKK